MTSKASVLESHPKSGRTNSPTIRSGITIYGTFDGPWSYLASRRADLLGRSGVRVDWRAVEPSDLREARAAGHQARLHRVRSQLDQVLTELLPGEQLAYSFPESLPETKAAVLAYAAAEGAGVGAAVRPVLFDALWVRGLDLGDAEVVHTLITDAWSGHVPAEEKPMNDEFRGAAPHDEPGEAARLLRQRWRDELCALGGDVLPVLVVDGRARLHGGHAVGLLGEEVARRGLEPGDAASPHPSRRGVGRGQTSRGSSRGAREH